MSHKKNKPSFDAKEETHASAVFGLLATLWRHKWLLILGLTVGVIGGLLYSSRLAPEYQSSLKLLIIKKRPEGLPGADSRNSLVEDYLSTHQLVIRSPVVVNAAVQKGRLQTLASFEKTDNVTNEIVRSLNVTREATEGGSTSILSLSYRSAVPDDCAIVLDAVVESYREFLGVTYENVSEETLVLITKAKELLENRLTKKEEDYRAFRVKHPALLRGKDGTNTRQERLFSIETKRSGLLVRQAEIDERLAEIDAALKSGDPKKQMAIVAEIKTTQPKFEKDETLASLEMQEQVLLEDFAQDHPQVRAIRKRIDALKANSTVKQEEPKIDPVQANIASLKRELEDVKTSEKALSKLLTIEQADAQKVISYEIQDELFRKDIAREQQLFDGIVKRLQEINLFKSFGGYDARCINPAGPAAKVGPRTVPIFVMACLLGLVGGMALAYLAEITDQSFRSPEEIRRRLKLEIVGQIPMLSNKGEDTKAVNADGPALAPILCTYYQPKSRDAEAYRGVRTGLFFSTQGKGHKVIQITSPSAGDGKSTLAANLAISIANANKRVLLLDADSRRPTIHKLFGLSSERGLASVLMGKAEPADVIQASGVAGLSVLPCGPIPANPAELLSLPRFKELLDYLREQYDFIIIDTPPMLAVTDPCMVAPHADGVLLTLRLSKQTQPAAVRATEVLATLDANVIGVVVNAVDDRGNGYGYGGYSYGYGAGDKYYQQSNHEHIEAESRPQRLANDK